MDTVHVFVTTGRFRSFAEMRSFVEQTYTEDGDGIPSSFAREVGQLWYEPGCVECYHRPSPVPVKELLAGASYSEQWLSALHSDEVVDAAVCAFTPNVIDRPEGSSLRYLGAFNYEP